MEKERATERMERRERRKKKKKKQGLNARTG
jgi:hypothetical protein